jgi:magnesium-transporting ATPase (P-type)
VDLSKKPINEVKVTKKQEKKYRNISSEIVLVPLIIIFALFLIGLLIAVSIEDDMQDKGFNYQQDSIYNNVKETKEEMAATVMQFFVVIMICICILMGMGRLVP